jgi:hypothetical protein
MPLGAHKAAMMGVAGVSTGDVVLLYDTDHSNVASVSITSDITSTYGEYIFKFYNINPATDNTDFQFNASADSGSNYDVVKTTTYVDAQHSEGDAGGSVSYTAGSDFAQSTAFFKLCGNIGNAADESAVGELHLFNPASTTYVKHFYSLTNNVSADSDPYTMNIRIGGYFNTTSAVDAVQFKMSSGNLDGTIKMWGVK